MNDAIEATFVEARPLAVRAEAEIVPAFFGTMRPAEKIAYATEVADALKPILTGKKLVHKLNSKNPDDEYVELEGWQTCGNLCGVTAKIEWSRPLPDGSGFEARAVVVRVDSGVEIGAGEAVCTKSEKRWSYAEPYAIKGMAQTRAQSRALRGVLAWILVLAGYKPTPADEMPPLEPKVPPTMTPAGAPVGKTLTQQKDDALCARWTLATGSDSETWRAVMSGKTVSQRREIVEAAERGRIEAQERGRTAVVTQEPPSPAPASAGPVSLAQRRAALEAEGESARATVEAVITAPRGAFPVPSAVLHRTSKALFAKLGYEEAQRHTYYESVCGYSDDGEPINSWARVTAAGKAQAVVDALRADEKHQEWLRSGAAGEAP